jgi:tRNA A-37 threonylcarbamoyl transferase component Bud32/tetratricopeptide (TPR) repeat protein
MSRESWENIKRLVNSARELQSGEPPDFLDDSLAANEMLHPDREKEHFLEVPAVELLAIQMAARFPEQRTHEQGRVAAPGEDLAALKPGVTLNKGRYVINELLERGGMALVYLARDTKLDMPVVIKVLREDLIETDQRAWFEHRFWQEITALTKINHPGVVSIFDFDQLDDGRTYLVMKYVNGLSLRSYIPPQGLDLETVARLIHKIGGALAAAHDQGVVHGDLKPENIMVECKGEEEHVHLIDFGMAIVRETSTAFRSNYIAGTLAYMAHELLQSNPTTASDIYALGVIAYEMLTGGRPFHPINASDLSKLQRNGITVKRGDLRSDISGEALAVIVKALSFIPGNRYLRVRLFTRALERALLNPLASLMLSAPVMALSFGLTIVISQRFLSGGPDLVGVSISVGLTLLCLLVMSTFTQIGQQWLRRGLLALGLKLQLQGRRRILLPIATLSIVCLCYLSLPALARIYNDRGVRFWQAENMLAAIESLDRAIHLDPKCDDCLYNRGRVFDDIHLEEQAIPDYESTIRLNPKHYYAYNNVARLYIVSKKDYAQALERVDAARTFQPKETSVLYTLLKNRGWAHFGLGLYDMAVEDLTAALKWREDGATPHCLLALVFDAQNRDESLVSKECRACIAYSPGDKDVQATWLSWAQERLRQMKGVQTQ